METETMEIDQSIFEEYESGVRAYCRNFPAVFKDAKGSIVTDVNGKEYIDFFNGAGALNYGHNNPYIKGKVLEYLQGDGILHWLDMMTVPKAELIATLEEKLLQPRGLNYKILFPAPTGTNAVEAALKTARKYTGRNTVWALMGAFHGMTLGALSLTTDRNDRRGSAPLLGGVVHMPAPYMFPDMDTISYMQTILDDDHSGYEKPAAMVIETVQAEGGVYVLSEDYLRQLAAFCKRNDILLIVDDIQVGCARTGTFFSFERAGIVPDIVVLSKSIGGIGLPLALTLIRPEIDCLAPGEHNGTFRGNQLAFVASKASIEYMLQEHVESGARERGKIIEDFMKEKIAPLGLEYRGIGCIWGIDMGSGQRSRSVMQKCFANGLIMERAGRNDRVNKLMPSLVIPEDLLRKALDILYGSVTETLRDKSL